MNNGAVWPDWPLILAYHSVSEHRQDALAVRTADFAEQMAWLHRHGYRSVTLAQFASQTIKKGERIVIITFDDGYADNYTQAFRVLRKYEFVATVFLVSDYVNTDHIFAWDAPKIATQGDPAPYRVLTWEQVQEMAAYGFEFGSHTCTHRELTRISVEQRLEEIVRSRADLQAKLGCKVVSFCYPRGALNTDVIQMVEEAGYCCAVVTPTRAGSPLCRYTLRRVGIYHNITPVLFQLKIMPFVRRHYESLKRLAWN